MANDNTETLAVELKAKIDDFEKSFNSATSTAATSWSKIEARGQEASDRIQSAMSDAASGITDSLGGIGTTGTVIFAGIAGTIALTLTKLHSITDELSKMGDRADDLRLPVNLLQALSVAADKARLPAEKLNSALDEFSDKSKKTADDAKDFYTALGNIDKSAVKAFQNAPTQAERLRIISDALHSTSNEVKRAQLANEAFGNDNERLIKVLGAGSAGIGEYINQARALGLAIDENAVRKAQEARSELNLLARVFKDDLSSSLAGLIPMFSSLMPYLEKIGGVARDVLAIFASEATAPIEALKDNIGTLQNQIEKLNAAKAALQSSTADNSLRDSLRKIIGVYEAPADEIKDIDEQITKTEAEIARLKTLVAQKQKIADDASRKGGAGTEDPAFKPRPKLDKSDDDNSKSFDRTVDPINRHIAALQADAAAVGMNKTAHASFRAELQMLQAAQRDDSGVTNEQIDKYAQLRATMSAQQALTAAGIKLNADHAESFNEVTKRVTDAAGNLDAVQRKFESINSVAQFGGNQLIDTLDKIRTGTAGWRDALNDVINALIKAVEQAALLGTGPLAGIFGTASTVSGGTGGFFGSLFGTGGGGSVGKAGGGFVRGPGTATSDSISARLSDGEFVVRASEASKHAALLTAINEGRVARFADGGAVGAPRSIPSPAGISIGGTMAQQTVNYGGIHIHGQPGTPNQNQDLTDRMLKALDEHATKRQYENMRQAMKPGGVLHGVKRGNI